MNLAHTISDPTPHAPELREVPPPRTPTRLVAFEVLDESAAKDLDPLLARRGVMRLDCALSGPATVKVADVEVLHIEPTADGQKHAACSGDVYAAIATSLGEERASEACDRWHREAEAWARDALEGLPATPLSRWRHEDRARRAMVADRLVHSFGLTLEQAAAIVGGPVELRRSLWPALMDAKVLDEKARIADEAKALAEAEAAAVRAEALRPKTLREQGLEIVAVSKARNPLGGSVRDLAPFKGAMRVAETDGEVFYAWLIIPALELPPFDHVGVRSIPRDETFMCQTPPTLLDPTKEAFAFCKAMRECHGKGIDRGPVTKFTEDGLERARDLARKYRHVFGATILRPDRWLQEHLPELLVRGLRQRPDVAASLILGRYEPPRSEGWQPTEQVEALCVAAAQKGHVSVGALLDEPLAAPKKHGKGKA